MSNNFTNTVTIWITGLSGSGKTTLANSIKKTLKENGINSIVLDGDNIRKTINKDLTFSIKDREENNRRVAEIARIMNISEMTVICALITPTNKIREIIRKIIGEEKFILVYMNTPIKTCELRDKKQLYHQAKQGTISDFTGISSIYEEPLSPDVVINSENSLYDNLEKIILLLKQRYHYKINW